VAWPKGKPRPANSGRKKGTPNKNSMRVEERLHELGVDLIGDLIAYNNELMPFQRTDILVKLLPYVHPKRTELKFDIQQQQALVDVTPISTADRLQLLKTLLERREGNAVQIESTARVDVREQTKDGKAVGAGDTGLHEITGTQLPDVSAKS